MSAKDRTLDFLFYLLIGTLYCYAMSRAILAATVLEISQWQVLKSCALALLALYLVLWNRKTALVALCAVALSTALLFFYLLFHRFQVEWFGELAGFVGNVVGFIFDIVPYQESFVTTIVIWVAALMALLVSVNLRLHFSFYGLALPGFVILSMPALLGYGQSAASVPIYLFCVVLFLVKKLNLNTLPKEKGSRQANPVFSLALIPFCLLIVGVSWLLPRPDIESIAQGRNVRNTADNLLDNWSDSTEYFFSDTSQELGGPVTLGRQIVMEVESEEPLYLAGSYKDQYTGTSWNHSVSGQEQLELDDSGWFLVPQYDSGMVEQQKYYMRFYGREQRRVTVYVGAGRTRTIHTPPFRQVLWLAHDVYQDSLGALHSDQALIRPIYYVQEYISWDYDNYYFITLLQELSTVRETSEDLDIYRQLPESLPDRVEELARELTAGLGNDYDRIKALEVHLKQFPYTLSPDPIPAGEDFVDYFLFEGQEGYCVYYATSLAVMARTLGIPARYVEGFVTPQSRNEEGTYTVTGAQAHAWTEVWFPEFGWVRFEPTSANFRDNEDLVDQDPPEEESEPEEESSEEEAEESEEESQESSQEESRDDPEEESSLLDGNGEEEEKGSVAGVVRTVLILLLFVGGGVWGILALQRRRERKIRATPTRELIELRFGELMGLCATLGFPPQQGETAHAFAARVSADEEFGQGFTVSLDVLAEIASRAAFSQNPVTTRDLQLVEQACKELEGKCKTTLRGKLRLLLRRYLYFLYR